MKTNNLFIVGLVFAFVLTSPFVKAQSADDQKTEPADLLKSIQSIKGKLELNTLWRKITTDHPQYKDPNSLIHAAYIAKNATLLTQAGFFEESLQSLRQSPIQPVSTFPFAYEFNAIMILNYDWNISREAMEGYRKVYLNEISSLTYKPDSVNKDIYIAKMESELAKMDGRMANMYYHTGAFDKAMDYAEKALANSRKTPHVNELYTTLLSRNNHPNTFRELELFVVEGAYTPTMKTLLEQLHREQSDEEFETYFARLEIAHINKIKQEISKKLIKERAPLFALKDLKGQEVNLSDYLGRTVVLDFWATWCGPCIMSFPTMTKARDLFVEEGKDVVFLFVDTGEKETDFTSIQTKVLNFLENKPYTMEVLFDLDDKMQQSYEISGLPTKLFIDPKGNIRYKSTGFNLDEKKAITEMRSVLELIQ